MWRKILVGDVKPETKNGMWFVLNDCVFIHFGLKKQVATLLLTSFQIMNGLTIRGAHQVENFAKVIDAYYLTG